MKFFAILIIILFTLTACTKAEPVTTDEVDNYIRTNNIKVIDYKILNNQSALILEVNGPAAQVYEIKKQADKTFYRDSIVSWKEDEEGVSVKKTYGYLCISIHDKAIQHDMDFVNIYYVDDTLNEQKSRFEFNGKQGVLMKLPESFNSAGYVEFYGNDGFIQQIMF